MTDEVRVGRVTAEVHGRYLVKRAPQAGAILVGFHGFAETAGTHLEELERLPGLEDWTLVAIEALHPFYTRAGAVVASWMTRQDRELAIEENVAYVRSVLSRLVEEEGDLPMAMLGFSQGTAMAYRAAARGGRSPVAVVALGGDMPPELVDLGEVPFSEVLICRGRSEDWYSPETMERDVALLGELGIAPRTFEFDGGHEFTDEFRAEAADFLRRALSPATRP